MWLAWQRAMSVGKGVNSISYHHHRIAIELQPVTVAAAANFSLKFPFQ